MKRKAAVVMFFAFFFVMGLASSGHGVVSQFIQKESINGIMVMTGGVGLEEREQMKAMADPYSLKLEFAVSAGSYLANVRFSLEKADGTELMWLDGTGPLVYLGLEPGRYMVKAWHEGIMRTAPVEVRVDKTSVILSW